MTGLTFEQIENMKGVELYEYAVSIIKTVHKDMKDITEWKSAEGKRWFWQKEKEKPKMRLVTMNKRDWYNDYIVYHISRTLDGLERAVKHMNENILVSDREIPEYEYKIILLKEVMNANKIYMLDDEVISATLKKIKGE